MIKKDKISDKDLRDWKDFLEKPSNIYDKGEQGKENTNYKKKFRFDLHGYSIEKAKSTVFDIIEKCHSDGFSEIILVTGKGLHSNSEESVYVSKDHNKLKYIIPEYIKTNEDLNSKIIKVYSPQEKQGGEGVLILKIKKLKNKS